MTQKTLSSERRPHIVTGRYMFDKAKRGWSVALLFFIAFALFFTIQAMVELSAFSKSFHEADWSHAEAVERIKDFISALRLTFVVLSALSAIFAGCYFFAPMHNKTSAIFFHSLPERRSGHFISAIFASAVTFFIGAVSNFVLTFLIFAANGFLFVEVIGQLFGVLLWGSFYFIVFLSFTMLAGSFSGTTPIHAIMTAFLLFFIPATYLSLMLLLSHNISYLDISSMMFNVEAYNWMSPVFRALYVILNNKGFTTTVWTVVLIDAIVTVGVFALAYYAYKKRPVERTGTPIIYAPLSETVKYIIIGPSAVFMSEIFSAFFGYYSDIWSIFGFVLGLLLVYMLCNTVLNRSAKAMFSHKRGMLVYSAAACIAAFIFSTGFFGILEYAVPISDKLTVDLGEISVTITKNDDVKRVREAIKGYVSLLKSGDDEYNSLYHIEDGVHSEVYDKYGEAWDELLNNKRSGSFSVTYGSILGMPIKYRYHSVTHGDMKPIIDALLECDELYDSITPDFSLSADINMDFLASSSLFLTDDAEMAVEKEKLQDIATKVNHTESGEVNHIEGSYEVGFFGQTLAELMTPKSKEFFQRQVIGSLSTDIASRDSVYGYRPSFPRYFPLYFDDFEKILDVAASSRRTTSKTYLYDLGSILYFEADDRTPLASLSYNEYIDALSKTISAIYVLDWETKEVKTFEGSDIKKLLPSLASVNGQDISPLTKTDTRYTVGILYKTVEHGTLSFTGDDAEAEADAYPLTSDLIVSDRLSTTWFLEGEVPELVK